MALFNFEEVNTDLKVRNTFIMGGSIDEEMFFKVRDFFTYFESKSDLESGEYPDIKMKIDSFGGDYSKYGKDICIMLNEYQGHITGVATANCSSMAFLILQNCDKRIAYENVRMVPHLTFYTSFHDRLTSTVFEKLINRDKKMLKDLKHRLKTLLKDDKVLSKFLSKKSNLSKKKVLKLLKKDKTITAKKALKMGFIDEIIPAF